LYWWGLCFAAERTMAIMLEVCCSNDTPSKVVVIVRHHQCGPTTGM
jgi:hypothetical protein